MTHKINSDLSVEFGQLSSHLEVTVNEAEDMCLLRGSSDFINV